MNDNGVGLSQWATCIAVLFSAVIKLSGVLPRDANGQPSAIAKVWRGVRETDMALPLAFLEACDANQGYPGGAEMAFSSTTTDIFTSYIFSGGWDLPGTILEITFDAASRGADISFLSCFPREREILLPPFSMLSTHSVVRRGKKRLVRCSLTVNPGTMDLAIATVTDIPRLSLPTAVTIDAAAAAGNFVALMRCTHPEYLDPFTSALMEAPVTADDGCTYERARIEHYIAQQTSAGGQIISPTTHMPMSATLTPNAALADAIAAARAAHAEALRTGGGSAPDVSDAAEPVALRSIDELGDIFASLDSLTSFLPNSLEHWSTPSFVVLGSESSGKSTLLERISMFPMFPRGEGVCTRIAIKVELRRTLEAHQPELQLVDLESGQPVGPPTLITLEGERAVAHAMQAVIGGDQTEINITQMLVLRVRLPSVPTLNLVDLPGLVQSPETRRQQTLSLADRFIATYKERSVFLLVCPASEPPRNSSVIPLVERHGIEARCIGVVSAAWDP